MSDASGQRVTEGFGQVSEGATAHTPANTPATQQFTHSDRAHTVLGTEQRFDGREPIRPHRSNPWSDHGSVYTDSQAFGSTIGDVPALDSYGDVSGMYNAELPPTQQQHAHFAPTQPDNVGESQNRSGPRQRNPAADQLSLYAQQQAAANAQEQYAIMRWYSADRNDQQLYRRSHSGHRD